MKTKKFKSKEECIHPDNDTAIEDRVEFNKLYDVLDKPKDYYQILEKNYIPPKIKVSIKNANINYSKLVDNKINHKIYEKSDLKAIKNTFFYILLKFHVGLFVSIRNNKLHQFYLIRSKYFKNQYPHLQLDPMYYKKYNIQPSHYWRMMGCMVNSILNPEDSSKVIFDLNKPRKRGLRPPGYYFEIKEWLDITLKNRKVSDVDFFLNFFDQLILTNNQTEPLFHFFKKNKVPLKKEFMYFNHCPIMAIGHTMDRYLDLPFISSDDISRITQRVYPGMCVGAYMKVTGEKINTNWNKKKPTAMFRGSATGCGTTVKNNPRIRLAYCGKKWKKDNRYNEKNKIDKIPFLDVGLTTKKSSFKKHEDDKYIVHVEDIIDTDDLSKRVDLVDSMSHAEQSNYKYIINVEGYVSAFRTTFLFGFNSVILYVNSDYKPWYFYYLEDYKNVIFINKNLSNLAEAIEWLKKNDADAKKIAAAGYKLYKNLFSKKGLLDYTQLLLNKIGNRS